MKFHVTKWLDVSFQDEILYGIDISKNKFLSSFFFGHNVFLSNQLPT